MYSQPDVERGRQILGLFYLFSYDILFYFIFQMAFFTKGNESQEYIFTALGEGRSSILEQLVQ